MRYAVIASHVGECPLSVWCRTLEVSVSGYYAWRRRAPSQHQQADEAPGSCACKGYVRHVAAGAHPAPPRVLHSYPIAPNLVERNFTAPAPNRTWVADITGIETQEGWLYLSGIGDVYSRRAVGYAMDTRRDEALVETALERALLGRRPQAGLVHHSDRGSQYPRWGYRGMLESYGMVLSMSGKGDPYDNALMESFFRTLKAEGVERHDLGDH